jgi:hypothetical protein
VLIWLAGQSTIVLILVMLAFLGPSRGVGLTSSVARPPGLRLSFWNGWMAPGLTL